MKKAKTNIETTFEFKEEREGESSMAKAKEISKPAKNKSLISLCENFILFENKRFI